MSPSSPCRLEQAIFLRKWVGFVSVLWLMLFSGCYTFANYSTALKEVMGINQKQLNWLGVARDVGDSCIGIIAGIFSSYLPVWALLFISAAFGLVGYGVEWLVVSQTIKPLSYWVMFIAAMTAGSQVCWMNVAVFNVSVRSFVRNRGPVSGLLKGFMGLSAAVFFVLCNALFSTSASVYVLMLMIIPAALCLVSATIFRPVPSAETQEEQKAEQTSLFVFNTMACMLAILIAVLTLLPSNLKEKLVYKVSAPFILIGIMVALAFVPVVMLLRMKESKSKSQRHIKESVFVEEGEVANHYRKSSEVADSEVLPALHHDSGGDDRSVSNDCEKLYGLAQPLLDNNRGKQRHSNLAKWQCYDKLSSSSFWRAQDLGEDKPTLSLFKTWHYYLFYMSLFCGCGSGVVFTNNLGQVGQSLGSNKADLFASLFSLGNFSGRLASGNISECFLRRKGVPRPVWMGLAKVPMIASFLWLSTGATASVYGGSLVLGFCHGSLVTLSVPIVSEFYGLKHFGTNFTLTSTYFLTGSYVLSSLAGYLYDRQAVLEEESTSSICYGSNCFGTTFQILASCLILALVCDVVLTIISRPLYQKLQLVIK